MPLRKHLVQRRLHTEIAALKEEVRRHHEQLGDALVGPRLFSHTHHDPETSTGAEIGANLGCIELPSHEHIKPHNASGSRQA